MGDSHRRDVAPSLQDGEAKDLASIGKSIVIRLSNPLLNHPGNTSDLDQAKLQHEYERFSLWTDNLGLHHRGHSSLDYRLRDSDSLRDFIQALLDDLLSALDQLILLHDDALSHARDVPAAAELSDPDVTDEDADEYIEALEDYNDQSEAESILLQITDINDNLYKFATRLTSPKNRLLSSKAKNFRKVNKDTNVDLMKQFDAIDEMHIMDLLCSYRRKGFVDLENADEGKESKSKELILTDEESVLLARLARANTLRRKQFGHWERHRAKVHDETKRALDTTRPEPPITMDRNQYETRVPVIDGERASTFFSKPTTATAFLDSRAFRFGDTVSTVSAKSVSPQAKSGKDEEIWIPEAPNLPAGSKHFACPFCYAILNRSTIESQAAWREHVLRDLRPYICTYPDCIEGDQLYDNWKDWAAHEQWSHNKVWRCSDHADLIFDNVEDFNQHLKIQHADRLVSPSYNSSAYSSTSLLPERPCPLCLCTTATADSLQRHIATHLQRIALFALPRSTNLDTDGTDGNSKVTDDAQVDDHDSRFRDIDSTKFSDTSDTIALGESALLALTESALHTREQTAEKQSDNPLQRMLRGQRRESDDSYSASAQVLQPSSADPFSPKHYDSFRALAETAEEFVAAFSRLTGEDALVAEFSAVSEALMEHAVALNDPTNGKNIHIMKKERSTLFSSLKSTFSSIEEFLTEKAVFEESSRKKGLVAHNRMIHAFSYDVYGSSRKENGDTLLNCLVLYKQATNGLTSVLRGKWPAVSMGQVFDSIESLFDLQQRQNVQVEVLQDLIKNIANPVRDSSIPEYEQWIYSSTASNLWDPAVRRSQEELHYIARQYRANVDAAFWDLDEVFQADIKHLLRGRNIEETNREMIWELVAIDSTSSLASTITVTLARVLRSSAELRTFTAFIDSEQERSDDPVFFATAPESDEEEPSSATHQAGTKRSSPEPPFSPTDEELACRVSGCSVTFTSSAARQAHELEHLQLPKVLDLTKEIPHRKEVLFNRVEEFLNDTNEYLNNIQETLDNKAELMSIKEEVLKNFEELTLNTEDFTLNRDLLNHNEELENRLQGLMNRFQEISTLVEERQTGSSTKEAEVEDHQSSSRNIAEITRARSSFLQADSALEESSNPGYNKSEVPARRNSLSIHWDSQIGGESPNRTTFPEDMATLTRKAHENWPQRRFVDGDRVRLKGIAADPRAHDMIIAGARYNDDRDMWQYSLKEDRSPGSFWPVLVVEADLMKQQKFDFGARVIMRRNTVDPWDHDMVVRGATYNNNIDSWEYNVREESLKSPAWPGLVVETNLRENRRFRTGARVIWNREGRPWKYDMIVTEAVYNTDMDRWDYWLKEDTTEGLPCPETVAESDLVVESTPQRYMRKSAEDTHPAQHVYTEPR